MRGDLLKALRERCVPGRFDSPPGEPDLADLLQLLGALRQIDEELENLESEISEAARSLARNANPLDRYLGRLDHDPLQLDAAQQRLESLERILDLHREPAAMIRDLRRTLPGEDLGTVR